MVLALLLAGFAAWLFLPVPALTAAVPLPQRPAAQPGLPWLSVADGRIVDGYWRTVLLHGFNDDALLESTVHPAPLDETDARLMEQNGFDVVRLPIAWSNLEPHRGVFDEHYLDRIAAAVALLNEHDLYVVLDMHSLGYSPLRSTSPPRTSGCRPRCRTSTSARGSSSRAASATPAASPATTSSTSRT